MKDATGWNLIIGIGALVFLFVMLTAKTGKPLTNEHAKEDRSNMIITTIICVGIAIWSFLSL